MLILTPYDQLFESFDLSAFGRFHSNRHNSTTGHRQYLFLLSLPLNTLDIQFI